ncbi:MAG: hypothetical protein DWP98_12340 [Bacteroidetes bacterium]|nr:MAG: hypothetical protein DWP98_12340 [Bacteroidota bacterium]MBL1145494.1 hypothetical protein [Bacteroidota bacterium]
MVTNNCCSGQECFSSNFIYQCDDGICEEYAFSDSTFISDFSEDNLIYKDSLLFEFKYYFEKNGMKYFIKNESEGLASTNDTSYDVITKVAFMCNEKEGENMRMVLPNYRQSGLEYEYFNEKYNSLNPKYSSGLIDNCKNIWLHPFRKPIYFSILNLNPYPFVKLPVTVGDKYAWNLDVGGAPYTNELWLEWEGVTTRKFDYKVINKITKWYAFSQKIPVYYIKATANSAIGFSSAEFWYSETFGFVEMKYLNIDNSIFHFTLEKVENIKKANL